MNELRAYKGNLPGREKLKETRRLRQITRQQAARGSRLQGLRSFLTADSFMYGPLLDSPSTAHPSAGSDPQAPEREQENGGLGDNSAGNSAEEDKDDGDGGGDSGKDANGHEENSKVHQASTRSTTTTILSVQRMARTTARTAKTVPTEEGHTPTSALQIVSMLVSKVGGRYTTELGIDVDAADSEVERWFLAVTLFHRHLTFNVLKNTFQKLEEAGIMSLVEVLHMEEDELADLLETANYTTYKHRAAARLRKLAMQLEAEHEGKISAMKHLHDEPELHRRLSNLYGLTTNTATIFLRELQGIWPGAAMEYDQRTTRAAMHLQIGRFEQLEDAANKNNIPMPLTSIAEGGGVNKRDLEVALVKLGLAHERHYRACPGGLNCSFLSMHDKPTYDEEKKSSIGTTTSDIHQTLYM